MTTSTLSGGYTGLVDIGAGGGRELMLIPEGRLLADDELTVSDGLLAGTGGGAKEAEALDERPRVGLVASGGTGLTLSAPLV